MWKGWHSWNGEQQRAQLATTVRRVPDELTSGQLARELGVSHRAVLKWAEQGVITPEWTTPGGHHRWDLDKVRKELRQQRRRDD